MALEKAKLSLQADPRPLCICTIVPTPPLAVHPTVAALERASGVDHIRHLEPDTLSTIEGIRAIYKNLGVPCWHVGVTGLSYEHALAEVSAKALQLTEAEDILYVDADIACDPQWGPTFAAMPHDVLCGTYQQRTDPENWCINNVDAQMLAKPERSPEGLLLVPINDTGFGWVRIRRRTLEAMARQFPELEYYSGDPNVPGPCWALWDPFIFEHADARLFEGAKRRRRTAGDTCFFKRARTAGFQPWAVAEMLIDHAHMGPRSLLQWVTWKKEAQAHAESALAGNGAVLEGE